MSAVKPQIAEGISGWEEALQEENKDVVSPFLPIAKTIKFLSCVGCPLTILDGKRQKTCGAIQFSIVQKPLLKFTFFAFFPYCLIVVALVIYSFFGSNIWSFLDELQGYGFALMDVVAMFVLFIPLISVSMVQYSSVKKACKNLSILSLEISSIKHVNISPREAQEHFNIICYHLYMMTGATIISAFLYAYLALATQSINWNLYFFIFALILYGILDTLCYVPPMLLVTYILQQHSLGMVELALRKCADKFSEKLDVVVRAKIVGEEVIHEFIDTSIDLSRIVDTVGEALGVMMRVETVVDAFCGTFGFYFGTIIVSAFTEGAFNKMLFIGGLDFLIIGVVMTGRMVTLLGKGQGISDQLKRIKVLLRNVLLYQDPTVQDSKKIIYLLEKWSSDGGAPVRPCDLFDLNKSTGMSIAGVLLTYVVVLLQFKHGH